MPTTPSAGTTKAPYVYFRANPGAAAAQAYNPLVASFPQPNAAHRDRHRHVRALRNQGTLSWHDGRRYRMVQPEDVPNHFRRSGR